MLQEDLITSNIKKVKDGLADCHYIIERYDYEPQYEINPKTHRRKLKDYKFTVYPTPQFQQEQFRVNVHHKNLHEHRIDSEGKTLIKPMRDQYPNSQAYQAYLKAQERYDTA